MTTPSTVQPSRVVLAGMVADLHGHDDERAPLVLLHGLTFSRRTWRPVLDELDRLDGGRRVLVPDLPGHGESAAQPPHTYVHLLGLLHAAVEEAGLSAPVVVGHSYSAGLAAMYAASHPCRGLVSVDSAPADVPAFARLIRRLEPMVRGAGFERVWADLEASFQLHLLPPAMRAVVEATCRPEQDLLVSYWSEILEASDADIAAMLEETRAALAARRLPAVLVLGSPPSPALQDSLAGGSPAEVEVKVDDWSPSGHFPHLAHAGRFAELLAGTAAWTAPATAGDPAA